MLKTGDPCESHKLFLRRQPGQPGAATGAGAAANVETDEVVNGSGTEGAGTVTTEPGAGNGDSGAASAGATGAGPA